VRRSSFACVASSGANRSWPVYGILPFDAFFSAHHNRNPRPARLGGGRASRKDVA